MRQEYLSKSFVEIVELVKQSVKPSPEVNVHVSLDLLFMLLDKRVYSVDSLGFCSVRISPES